MSDRTGLKSTIREQLRGDWDALKEVGEVLGKAPTYVLTMIRNNDPRLTQVDVLRILKKHFKASDNSEVEDTELLEEINIIS
jgi:hypothetical protein